jgi:Coenzyme PQQ synthesis protein D (PqqD)
MLTADQRFRVNRLEVAAKVIDDEAIIMHLGSGMYYSMDRTGAVIWDWLERGHTVAQIIEGIVERYDVSPGKAGEDVEQLLRRLIEETLVQPEPEEGASVEPVAPSGGDKLAYTSPELNRYGDMADLLALDPPMPNLASTPWTDPQVDR